MTFSMTSFHFPRSWAQVIQFLTLIWQMSCLTLSSHLYMGLPCDLLVRGFHLNIFLTVLVSGILCTWPNQLSLWTLIWLTIFLCFISLSNSSLVLILHIWFSFAGPNILLKIFLSKTSNFWIMVSFSTHVSEAYVTIGLMTVLYDWCHSLSRILVTVISVTFLRMRIQSSRMYRFALCTV